MKSIKVTVSPTGETRVETKGFAGGSCRSASRFLAHALGRREGERLTAEFHAKASAMTHERQRD